MHTFGVVRDSAEYSHASNVSAHPLKQVVLPRVDLLLEEHLLCGKLLTQNLIFLIHIMGLGS